MVKRFCIPFSRYRNRRQIWGLRLHYVFGRTCRHLPFPSEFKGLITTNFQHITKFDGTKVKGALWPKVWNANHSIEYFPCHSMSEFNDVAIPTMLNASNSSSKYKGRFNGRLCDVFGRACRHLPFFSEFKGLTTTNFQHITKFDRIKVKGALWPKVWNANHSIEYFPCHSMSEFNDVAIPTMLNASDGSSKYKGGIRLATLEIFMRIIDANQIICWADHLNRFCWGKAGENWDYPESYSRNI